MGKVSNHPAPLCLFWLGAIGVGETIWAWRSRGVPFAQLAVAFVRAETGTLNKASRYISWQWWQPQQQLYCLRRFTLQDYRTQHTYLPGEASGGCKTGGTRQRWQGGTPTLPQSRDGGSNQRPPGAGSGCSSSPPPDKRPYCTRGEEIKISSLFNSGWMRPKHLADARHNFSSNIVSHSSLGFFLLS